jgi:acetyl-CoA carboxylase carboxyl transferase subunit alpha
MSNIKTFYCLFYKLINNKTKNMKDYLSFEKDIKNLELELEKLKDPFNQEGLSEVDTGEISKIQSEIDSSLKRIYSNLDPWQTVLVARHENRPKAKFFIENLFEDFIPLSGDRFYGEDKSVIAGFAKFDEKSVLVIGQEKGEDLESRIERNFGMMRPEGYRKTIRLMKLADKFKIPIITFIDTPGAYPGVGAEERGQAEAIAKSIECCMELKSPTISIIIGEGGSGGAIALASSNKVLMLENSIYSVISPEGCATILWRDPTKTLEAATAMKLSAKDLFNLKIIDEIIAEPIGGAHRDKDLILENVKISIRKNLSEFQNMDREDILIDRKNKFLSIGRNQGFINNPNKNSHLSMKVGFGENLKNKFLKDKNRYIIFGAIFMLFSFIIYIL